MGNLLAFFLVGHLVGDYILQNDYLANGKKKSSFICALHCALWTASVLGFGQVWNVFTVGQIGWLTLWLFGTHFVIDRWGFITWWMNRVSGQAGFAKNLAPWSIIVVDNVFHIVTLYLAVCV